MDLNEFLSEVDRGFSNSIAGILAKREKPKEMPISLFGTLANIAGDIPIYALGALAGGAIGGGVGAPIGATALQKGYKQYLTEIYGDKDKSILGSLSEIGKEAGLGGFEGYAGAKGVEALSKIIGKAAPVVIEKIKSKPVNWEIMKRRNDFIKPINIENLERNESFREIGKKVGENLEKANNNRRYVHNAEQNIKADVPSRFITESESKLFDNDVSAYIKKGSMEEFPQLFKKSINAKSYADMKGNPDIKQIHRYIAPIKHGDDIYPVNFVVREYRDGRKVLSDEIIDFNGGKDLSLYSMKVNEKALPGLDAPLTQSKPHVSNLPLRESDIRIQDLMKRIKDTSGIYDFSGIGYIKSYISHLLRNNIKKALMK